MREVRRDRHRRRPQRPRPARPTSRAPGKKVLVLERRHVLGGAAVTEEVFPGFKFSVCSYVVSLLRPGDHPRARPAAPRPRDPAARRHVHADAERRLPLARERSRQDAPRDRPPLAGSTPRPTTSTARRWSRWRASSSRSSPWCRPTRCRSTCRALATCCRLGQRFRSSRASDQHNQLQLMTMSAVDFLDQWFETDVLKATMSAPRASSAPSSACARRARPTCSSTTTWARSTAPSARGASRAAARARSPRPSPARRARPASRSAPRRRSRGSRSKDGRATGVVLENGDEIDAPRRALERRPAPARS